MLVYTVNLKWISRKNIQAPKCCCEMTLFLPHSSFTQMILRGIFLFLLRDYEEGKTAQKVLCPFSKQVWPQPIQKRPKKARNALLRVTTMAVRLQQWETLLGQYTDLATFCSVFPKKFLPIPFIICFWTFSPLFFPFPFCVNWYCLPPGAAASTFPPCCEKYLLLFVLTWSTPCLSALQFWHCMI